MLHVADPAVMIVQYTMYFSGVLDDVKFLHCCITLRKNIYSAHCTKIDRLCIT